MALSGVHITFGAVNYGVSMTSYGVSPGPTVLLSAAGASQTMASAGTSSISAPSTTEQNSKIALSISASAPIFYATGSNPAADGTGNAPRRYYDPVSGREDIFVNPGDKFAWTFA